MAKSLIGKVVALSRPLPLAPNRVTQGSMGLYGTSMSTQIAAMSGQGTLFAIVQLLSTGVSRSEWQMFRQQKDGRVRYSTGDLGSDQRQEVLQHQALKLWNRPNDFMTGDMFMEIGWQFMELVGEWYWVLNRGPSGLGIPIEMWPVRPDRMEPVPDRDKFLKGWVYTGPNGEAVPLDVSEVIQVKYPDPDNLYRGLSPVQSIMADIDSAKYTAEWSRNFFLNSATPGGIVQFSKRLTDDEFDEFTSRWREQHQGVARGHRVGVLEQGAQWIANTYTMRDMQFPELRKIGRDVIREAYRVHQSMLGNSEDVNRANAQTAEDVHIAWQEIPRLRRTRTALNGFYLPMFGSTGVGVEFDFKDPQTHSITEANEELTVKANAAAVLVKAGFDPKAVLETVGLPDMAWKPPPTPTAPAAPKDTAALPESPSQLALPAGSEAGAEPDTSTQNRGPSWLMWAADTPGGEKSTERLHEYWVHGEGAAKIRWGEPGDFDRCVHHLEKYIEDPKGYCADAHHAAIGVWPGQEGGGHHDMAAEIREAFQNAMEDIEAEQAANVLRAGLNGELVQ